MRNVNQDYLVAVGLAQRLMSQDQLEREAAWNGIWSERIYKRWAEVLRLLMGILVEKYAVEGAHVAQQRLRILAQQRSTPAGDPGYLGLALVLRSLREVTGMAPWEAADGPAFEKEIVALWVHELHKTTLYHILEQPVPLATLAHEVKYLSTPTVTFAVESLLEILFQEHNRHLHETLLHALDVLKDHLPVESLVTALQSEGNAVREAAQHLLQIRENTPSPKPPIGESDSSEEQVEHPEAEIRDRQEEHSPIEALLDELRSFDGLAHQRATRALIRLRNQVSTEVLSDLLHDPNERVREAAVQILGTKGKDVRAISALLSALHDCSRQVQESAMQALRALGEDVVDEALTFIDNDSRAIIRAAAAQVLGIVGEDAPVEALVAALHDSDWRVRKAAAEGLSNLGERVPVEQLLAALNDESERVYWAAAQAIGKRDNNEEDFSVEPLAIDLNSNHSVHRWFEVHKLGLLGKHAPVKPLLAALQDPDLSVRMEAVQALDRVGELVPMELLLEALRSDDWHVRIKAAEALGKRKEQAPIALLVSWLQASDAFTRMGAIQALGELIQYAPADPLIAALKDEHAGVREEVVRALGKLGQRAPFNELVTALTDEDKDVRRAVTYQLEVWRGERPVEPLIALLHDPEWDVREAAIIALKELGERIPLQVYLTALDDEMYLIRETAMQALTERAEELPIDLFVDALREKPDDLEAARNWSCGYTDHVRASAALAVGRFGARAPIEFLLEALDDGDASVRREAVTALGIVLAT